jgi:hypothetical protein
MSFATVVKKVERDAKRPNFLTNYELKSVK